MADVASVLAPAAQREADEANAALAEAHAAAAYEKALHARMPDSALHKLVALLQTGSPDDAKEVAACALTRAMHVVEQAGALPPLVALLETGSDRARLLTAVALVNITSEEATIVRVVEAGALPPLVSLLQAGSDKAKEYAAVAVHNITSEKVTITRVVEAGALPPLVALLQTGTDRAKERAASALGKIAREPAQRAAVVEAGALPPLVALVQTDYACHVKMWAASALTVLAQDERVRSDVIDSGAVLHLISLSADPLAAAAEKELAQDALDQLCASKAQLQLVMGQSLAAVLPPLRLEAAAGRERARELRAFADGASSTFAAHCDVTLKCADGEELGASRWLLAQTSSYHRSLFEAGGAEAASGVVAADPDFSSAAHAALLRQLHSLGEAPLPEHAGTVLELLRLAAKLQPPAGGSAELRPLPPLPEPAPLLERVIARCEAAVISGLDVSNCLDVLLQMQAGNSSARVSEAAEALLKGRLREVVAQPCWARFCVELPSKAVELLQAMAVQLSDAVNHSSDSLKRQRLG